MNIRRYVTLALALFLAVGIQAQKGAKGQKSKKRETAEYIAKREATILAFDSLLRAQISLNASGFALTDSMMEVLADNLWKEMNYDPELLSRLALTFAKNSKDLLAPRLFANVKQRHPKYAQVYIDHANLVYQNSLLEGATTNNDSLVKRAKMLLDSAKIVDKTSDRPYVVWLQWRTPFIKMEGVEEDLKAEIESWKNNFPQDSTVYTRAARTIMDAKAEYRKNANGSIAYDYRDLYDAEHKMRLAEECLEKGGPQASSIGNLFELTKNYFEAHYFPRGANVAEMGIQTHKADSTFHSWSLWNNAMAARNFIVGDNDVESGKPYLEHALASAQWLKEHQAMEFLDYVYAGVSYQLNQNYQEAIDAYNIALIEHKGAYGPQTDSVSIYRNLSLCYNSLQDVMDNGQRAHKLKEVALVLENINDTYPFNEWSRAATVFMNIRRDTIAYDKNQRMAALTTADSIYVVLYQECQKDIDSLQIQLKSLNLTQDSYDKLTKNLTGKQSTQRFYDYRHFQVLTFKENLDPSYFNEAKEQAELIISRMEPLYNESFDGTDYLASACRYLFAYYVNKAKDYKSAVPYAEKLFIYAPDASERESKVWKKIIDGYGSKKKRRK